MTASPHGLGTRVAHDPGDPLVTSHCFAGETRYWTRDGIKTLAETVDTVQEVLTNGGKGPGGTWREAVIHSYGEQPLWNVTLRRNKKTKVIRATAEHRWLVRNHGTENRAKNRIVVTSGLKPGHRLAWQLPKTRIWHSVPSPFGITHGVAFGDGSRTAWGSVLQLWGEKDAQLLQYFPEATRREPVKTPGGVDGVRLIDLPLFFKDRPPLAESVSYLYGWLAGYFAADGTVSAQGQAVLYSASRENIEFVQLLAARLGIGTYDVQEKTREGYGETSALYSVQFIGSTLRPEFFLIKEHRERYDAVTERGNAERIGWTVVSVEQTDQAEEVFCARVPETENFVLDGWISVMNCPFCGSGQVVGRSDGTISCDFCGQAYIVRVQPAFPGMPQMPMGPGAPSDVGPDGGLMDPSMIGPDGMAAGEAGGPPPADATEDPAEGEEGGPPDEDGGEEEESAPPPPKSKKKAARCYRGMQGQSLTEEQFVRHIAVVASGGNPKVMALLRSTARRKAGAHINEGTTPYRRLPTGHQVSVGRHGRDWYGMITHPESSQVHFMHVGDREPEDVHPEIDRQLARDSGTRAFLHATDPSNVSSADAYHELHPGEWYRGTGPGHAPSDWRPAIGSRRPFGQGRTAAYEWHNHEDMSPDELRAHMRTQHGFLDSPDDPDWLVDETHRNEHADAPLEHSHPDLAGEWEEGVLPIEDRDWLHQNGFEASRRAQGHTDADVRDLASLRAHMKADHDFGVAGMIPLRTLLGLHEDDHADTSPIWHGSSDSSRNPGFTAMTRHADSSREHWRRAMDSLEGVGFPDSQMRLDTGHEFWVYYEGRAHYHGRDQQGYHALVWHPQGDQDHNVEAYLGDVPEHVGPLLHHMFRRRDVLGHMRDQMDRAQGRGPDQTGNRLMIDMTRR